MIEFSDQFNVYISHVEGGDVLLAQLLSKSSDFCVGELLFPKILSCVQSNMG